MPENLAGQTLATRYRVLDTLGAGGMGVVYRARDERLERDVAIKVLSPGVLDDERVRKRFKKEALALSRLNHPNIAAVYDFVTEAGRDFIVMELVPGPTLDGKLSGGPLPQKEVLALGKQLAEALAAAHQEGVVHRDLKPANLRFTGDQRIKVLDFGLAEIHAEPNTQFTTASFRTDSSVSGTLPYMAPEQLRGDAPDVRSDVYAAGAVLYEMATAKRAFPQTGLVIVDAILNQPPQPPAQLNPQISPGLENAIMKALDKNPGYRYQTARDLLAELERLTSSNTISFPRPESVRLSTRGKRTRLIGGAIATLAILTAFAFLLLSRRAEPTQTMTGPVEIKHSTVPPSEPDPDDVAQIKDNPQPNAKSEKETKKKQAAAPFTPAIPVPPVPGLDPNAMKEAVREEAAAAGRDKVKNIAGQEGAAIGMLGSINGIASVYQVKSGHGYPPNLQALFQFAKEQGKGGGAAASAATECVMDPCIRGSYTFAYKLTSPTSYTVNARPIAWPYTGKRSFFMDQSGAVHATDENRPATAKDPIAK